MSTEPLNYISVATLSKGNKMAQKLPKDPFLECQQVERCEGNTEKTPAKEGYTLAGKEPSWRVRWESDAQEYITESEVGDENVGHRSHGTLPEDNPADEQVPEDAHCEDDKVDDVDDETQAQIKINVVLRRVFHIVDSQGERLLDGGKEERRRLVEKLGAAAGQVASARHSLGDSFRPADSCGPRERGLYWRERDRRERRTADYTLVIVSHGAENSSEGRAIGVHPLEGRVNNQLAMAQSAMFPVNMFDA